MSEKDTIEKLKSDLAKERQANQKLIKACEELTTISTALLIGIAKQFGKKVKEKGKLIGYKLVMEKANVEEVHKWDAQILEGKVNKNELSIALIPKDIGDE